MGGGGKAERGVGGSLQGGGEGKLRGGWGEVYREVDQEIKDIPGGPTKIVIAFRGQAFRLFCKNK